MVVADLLPRRLALAVPACTASRVRLAAPAAPATALFADLSLSLFLPAPRCVLRRGCSKFNGQ